MKNTISSRSSCLLSIPEVAWVLGIDESQVCRAIRVGLLPVVRRRRRLLVPAYALAHLADNGSCADPSACPVAPGGDALMNGNSPVNPDDFFEELATDLDVFELVPDDVLEGAVTQDGSCMVLYRLDLEPEWSGDDLSDRETAARICADCPVRRQCLELELRTSGEHTLGVWGALPTDDVRDLYPVWRSRRRRRGGTSDDWPSTGGGERA